MTVIGAVGDERGSVTVWLMILPILVMLVGGMTVDLWTALSARGRIAAIADEAAAAGATAVSVDSGRAQTQQVTLDPAEAQLRALVAVDTHPGVIDVTGRSALASPTMVEVTVTSTFDFLFLRLVGATSTPISVTARAAPLAVP